MATALERCGDCGGAFPMVDTPGHRYIGAVPSCWAVYTSLLATGTPGGRSGGSLVDAYAAQHPGGDSPQAVQSVAVHLITLHAVFAHRLDPTGLIPLRVRAVEAGRSGLNRYRRLEPPSEWPSTIASVADGAVELDVYVEGVYRAWEETAGEVIVAWHAACR